MTGVPFPKNSKADDEPTATHECLQPQHGLRMLWIIPLSVAKLRCNSTTAFDRWQDESPVKNWRFIASGVGLSVCAARAIVMSVAGSGDLVDRLSCSILLVSFGYLFLSRNSPLEAQAAPPWWW
jgi:hypothetical protein